MSCRPNDAPAEAPARATTATNSVEIEWVLLLAHKLYPVLFVYS